MLRSRPRARRHADLEPEWQIHSALGPAEGPLLPVRLPQGIDTLEAPIAHAEGRIAVRDPGILNSWRARGQIAVTYCGADDSASDELLEYPVNPNGSLANIAGLCDSSGRVFGLMPHPERFLWAQQHPTWTRERREGYGDGRQIFQNAVDYFL